ncbi:MAG TPA: DNA-3-methyladenine glycosylase [Gemmatimonadales bacterium]|nr:DNA-3-methyladenine glycosylase [Gemmatimonadales bacterium]
MRVLPLSFFRRPAETVARDLLGATVVSRVGGGRPTAGVVVEVEAYLGREDPASHAWGGRLNRSNRSLYAAPGTWYVYRSYGIHWCANLVCSPAGGGGAVLLRALLPTRGLDTLRRRRGGVPVPRIADGPGKLCQAFGITRELDGLAMPGSPVLVGENGERPAGSILVTPRIGITRAADWPLRFVLTAA